MQERSLTQQERILSQEKGVICFEGRDETLPIASFGQTKPYQSFVECCDCRLTDKFAETGRYVSILRFGEDMCQSVDMFCPHKHLQDLLPLSQSLFEEM